MVYSYEKPVVPVASSIHPYSIAQKQHSSSKNHCDKNGFPKMEIIMKADNMIRDVEKSLRDSEKNIDAARKNGITRAMPECRVSCAPTDPGRNSDRGGSWPSSWGACLRSLLCIVFGSLLNLALALPSIAQTWSSPPLTWWNPN